MAQYNEYPKTMDHPCGYKTITVYNAEGEMAVQQQFQVYREGNARAQHAAIRGESLAPDAAPTDPTGAPLSSNPVPLVPVKGAVR